MSDQAAYRSPGTAGLGRDSASGVAVADITNHVVANQAAGSMPPRGQHRTRRVARRDGCIVTANESSNIVAAPHEASGITSGDAGRTRTDQAADVLAAARDRAGGMAPGDAGRTCADQAADVTAATGNRAGGMT